ncbi:tetratricopeptide repeat protein [Catellatospora sp. NPDC049133]|uniref:tetratricopeptide repeat protein n=1 Tax=Catellatospora sp. NPDC049133 TaxID=3155499 RepID=UPI0033D737C2
MSDPVAQGDDLLDDLQRAEALLTVGRPDAAGQILAGVLGRHPDNAPALCLLAIVESKRGDHRAMLRAADAAVAAEPSSDWAHRLRSTALRHRCRPLEAREAALEAVRLAPDNWACHIVLAESELLDETVVGVEAAYLAASRAVELAPDEPDAHLTLGRVHAAAFDPAYAQACYEQALALDPQHVAARNNLAVEQLRTGRYTAGGRTLIDALAQDPQHDLLHRNLGQAVHAWLHRLADGAVLAWLCWAAVLLSGSPRAERIAGGALAVLVAAGAGWSYARLPTAMRRLVRRLPARAEYGRIAAWACVAVPFVALLLRPVASTPALRGVAAGLTLFAVIAAFVTASRAYTRVLGAAARLHRRWRHRVFLRRGARQPDSRARGVAARYTALRVVAIAGRVVVGLAAVGVVSALILRPHGETAPPPAKVPTGQCLTSPDGGAARPGVVLAGQAQLVACDDARAVYRVTGVMTLPSTAPDGPQAISCGDTAADTTQTVMIGWHDGGHVVSLCLTAAH